MYTTHSPPHHKDGIVRATKEEAEANDEDFDGTTTDFYAWKGYDFDILNELDDADYIRQGNHPSRSKSVYITESGMEQAKELLSKYGISDWKQG